MSAEDADAMQSVMEKQQSVTTEHERGVQTRISYWQAIREGDVDRLKLLIGWPNDRTYVPDPLGEKISESFADMMFGEDPTFTSAQEASVQQKSERDRIASASNGNGNTAPKLITGSTDRTTNGAPGVRGRSISQEADESANEGPDFTSPPDGQGGDPDEAGSDQERLNDLVESNDLPSELRHAEVLCSSEGEVWWRIYVDLGQMEYPIIEWHSRSHVRPLFRGRRLIAAAFVSEIFRETVEDQWEVWRYIEIQTEGYVRNLLYKGTSMGLGSIQPLARRPETEGLKDDWSHDLGILAGRIPNKLGRDRRAGRSDYESVKDLLLALNEATTIGAENARLTAKKRIAVPREALGKGGTFDAGEDVIVMDEPLDDQLGKQTGGGRFAVLEYQYDAAALIAHKDDLAGIILTRVGIAEQFINPSSKGGGGAGGFAASGSALRVRLIPTTLATKGKARFWDDALPKILLQAQLVDALPEQQGGFGRSWDMAGEPPVVERAEPLPQDEVEEVARHVAAVGGEIESRRTAISDLHSDWSDDQVAAELAQIKEELQEFGAPPVPGQPPGAPPSGGGAGAPTPPPAAPEPPAGPARTPARAAA